MSRFTVSGQSGWGLLCGKSFDEWLSIEKNWLSDLGYENSISKTLKLSFDHFSSPSLKKCFAYCSIYPKGYDFQKERLVELWMAEGFLGGNDDMEVVGNKFINLLLEYSLLQVVKTNRHCNITYYNMHDLVHDLASSILNSSDQVRHIGLQSISGESCVVLNEQANCLRSLLTNDRISNLMFSEFKSLHVLILMGYHVEELPSSIRVLIHLRCLDISDTRIRCLPDSIGQLYHLQTLRACHHLVKLPNTMKHLISLRHLHIRRGIEFPPWEE
ncbi:PREDICTED: putative disease resistance protein RGA3 [Erythranthe guttata]|uniref:putative disease resistance protein RGA3 n=1 Tax=Erythranthe guttata TaxID=4155 RepID=UPI00064DA113|nr:PREDICTED: putative disease resistance protein RGA3 [Erythranthe guttata]|eukprot:XP_012829427.1 PREDICTED: putative disease resistance protein RGA3 [Erythranthe guttata]